MKEKYVRSLIKLTKSTSEKNLNALIEHLCKGKTQAESAQIYGVRQEAVARLSTRIKKLDIAVSDIIEQR